MEHQVRITARERELVTTRAVFEYERLTDEAEMREQGQQENAATVHCEVNSVTARI